MHPDAEFVAKAYHTAFREIAPSKGLPPVQKWEDWDEDMRGLATAVLSRLLSNGTIRRP